MLHERNDDVTNCSMQESKHVMSWL